MPFSFPEIFERELSVINFRRAAIQSGKVAEKRPGAADLAGRREDSLEVKRAARPPVHFLRDRKNIELASGGTNPEARSVPVKGKTDLTGLAFSGGGIRSASVCLGVLQGLDSLSDHGEPHVLDAIDYLSVVSGGSYIGTSLVTGMMQSDYTFPFDSKIGDQEPAEMQHLRDYSNFLVPNGAIDYLISAALVFRGLLLNALIVLPVALFFAALTILFNPTVSKLGEPDIFGIPINKEVFGLKVFVLTADLAIAVAIILFVTALAASILYKRESLLTRETAGKFLAWCIVAVFVCAFFEFQSFVLKPLIGIKENPIAWLGGNLGAIAAALVPAATILVGFAQRLANIAQANVGEITRSGKFKKYAARAAIYLAALIVPFLLWVVYLYLSAWGIAQDDNLAYSNRAPQFLKDAADFLHRVLPPPLDNIPPMASVYILAMIVLFIICLAIGPNGNSLHRLYRDRLSRAFLIARADPRSLAAGADAIDPDLWKFSSLKPGDPERNEWEPSAAYSPYLLVNTAINLEASKDLNRRGRNADTFIFSPLHVGSSATGYADSRALEQVETIVGLATAMATSGAAASANMGANTIKVLTFSLSVLNIRLGYWLANPNRLSNFSNIAKRLWSNFGAWYFVCETFGQLNEKRLNVYLTDGGHIENLGIYELLRRRCKVIVAVDVEADQEMSFPSFVKLQVLARIDLGFLIDLPWPPLQVGALKVTDKVLHGPKGWPGSNGPHAAIGRIDYGEGESGVLIYIKASMSGDESDYLIDYKRRNPTFPHETTIDQFFSEEQFEVYRALGFHAARSLFTGTDSFGTFGAVRPGWKEQVRDALALLNIPAGMADGIVDRVDPPQPPPKAAPVTVADAPTAAALV